MDTSTQIRDFLAETFMFSGKGFTLQDDASLLEAGVVDSTGILELIVFVEDTFDVQIPDEDIVPENFDSVERIAKYVDGRTGQPPDLSSPDVLSPDVLWPAVPGEA